MRGFFVARRFVIALAEPLDEADGGADEVELSAQLILQEAFVAEMQRSLLIGENKKCRRADFRLGDVVNAHGASAGSGTALQIHFFLEPVVERRRRNAALAGFPALIDQRKELVGALAG